MSRFTAMHLRVLWFTGTLLLALCGVAAVTPGVTPAVWAAPLQQSDVTLVKTVGLKPGECASTTEVDITVGLTVTYCYALTNNSSAPIVAQTLLDNDSPNGQTIVPWSAGGSALVGPGATLRAYRTVPDAVTPNPITANTAGNAIWTIQASSAAYRIESNETVVRVVKPAIQVTLTVGASAGCGTGASLSTGATNTAYYCVKVQNTSSVTLTNHEVSVPTLNLFVPDVGFSTGAKRSDGAHHYQHQSCSAIARVGPTTEQAYVDQHSLCHLKDGRRDRGQRRLQSSDSHRTRQLHVHQVHRHRTRPVSQPGLRHDQPRCSRLLLPCRWQHQRLYIHPSGLHRTGQWDCGFVSGDLAAQWPDHLYQSIAGGAGYYQCLGTDLPKCHGQRCHDELYDHQSELQLRCQCTGSDQRDRRTADTHDCAVGADQYTMAHLGFPLDAHVDTAAGAAYPAADPGAHHFAHTHADNDRVQHSGRSGANGLSLRSGWAGWVLLRVFHNPASTLSRWILQPQQPRRQWPSTAMLPREPIRWWR